MADRRGRQWVGVVMCTMVLVASAGCEGGGTRGDGDVGPEADVASAGEAPDVAWTTIVGASGGVTVRGVAVDGSGNVYVAGRTGEGLAGRSYNGGESDGFVAKYDASGTWQWGRLQGAAGADEAEDVVVDGSGNVYVAGRTDSGFGGRSYHGGRLDGYLVKYDASGAREWVRLPGTASFDDAKSVAVGRSGGVYVAGDTDGGLGGRSPKGGQDGFVVKFGPGGQRRWVRLQGGAQYDGTWAVASGRSGAVYVVGETTGDLGGETNAGGEDGFVVKYGSEGERRWVRLHGNADLQIASSVTTGPNGNIYVGGRTNAGLDDRPFIGGQYDGYIVKYDPGGARQWVRHQGTTGSDRTTDLATNASGDLFVVGKTKASLGGLEYQGGEWDAFAVKYDASGRAEWELLQGTPGLDAAESVAIDGSGNVYFAGETDGNLNGRDDGGFGARGFIVRLQ